MRFENGKIKPCPNCLRARQKAKDIALKASGRFKQFTLVECEHGDFTIDNTTHSISATNRDDWSDLVGKKVYISGVLVYDVDAAKPIGRIGKIIKITKTS